MKNRVYVVSFVLLLVVVVVFACTSVYNYSVPKRTSLTVRAHISDCRRKIGSSIKKIYRFETTKLVAAAAAAREWKKTSNALWAKATSMNDAARNHSRVELQIEKSTIDRANQNQFYIMKHIFFVLFSG